MSLEPDRREVERLGRLFWEEKMGVRESKPQQKLKREVRPLADVGTKEKALPRKKENIVRICYFASTKIQIFGWWAPSHLPPPPLAISVSLELIKTVCG